MKKLFVLSVSFLLLIFLYSCGKNSSTMANPDTLTEQSENTDAPPQSHTTVPDEPSQDKNTPDSIDNPENTSSLKPLKVTGTQLTDASGNPVQLRGISTHGLSWFPDYVNMQCFSELKNTWNANVIRLAMYTAEYNGYCTGGNQENLKALVCSGIEHAQQLDMYVIVDWHILSDHNPHTYIEESKAFFHEISSKYADSNHILYEICNEPNNGTSWSDVKSYAETIIPIIRANDPDAIIIVGTANWCQYVDQAAADPITDYENIMYSLHFYAATHKDDLRNKMSAAVNAGLPIFVTEYGICDASGNGIIDTEQANLWISQMNQLGISYVAWNLSNKEESSAILKSSCSKLNGFTQEDLSSSGKWLFEMLTGQTVLPPATPANSGQSPANNTPPDNNTPSTSIPDTITNGNLEISLTITGSWESNGIPYYQYSLSIKSNGPTSCSNWTIELPCDSGINLSDSWNGIYSLNGNTLHISSADYNGTIPAGGSISDIGFIVYGGKIL